MVARFDKLSHLLRTSRRCLGSCAPQGITGRDAPASATQSAAQHGWRAPAATLQNSFASGSAGLTCPGVVQFSRLRKCMPAPVFKPGGTGGLTFLKSGGSLGPCAHQTKQLPLPSKGLPCFNSEPQIQAL